MAERESNEEIVQRLSLISDPKDTSEIRRELKMRLSEVHPDR
jgi:hypothetical protein